MLVHNEQRLEEFIQKANIPAEKELLLKDLPKQTEGMPSILHELNPHILNQRVVSYHVDQQGGGRNHLQVRLNGHSKEIGIQMDHVPHLRQEVKNGWLEQAANGVKQEMSRSLDLSK